jgi:hypothetical protein
MEKTTVGSIGPEKMVETKMIGRILGGAVSAGILLAITASFSFAGREDEPLRIA